MAGYTLQGKTSNGAMVDIPLAATYDSAGNNIISTYAAKADIEPQLASIEEIIKYRLPLGVATWEQIDAIAKLGIAHQVWKVGDEKKIQLTSGENVILQIWDFNHDDLTAGGKAPITFGLKDALATAYKMNNSNTNLGGWESSAMRTTLSTTIYNLLPAALKAVIKSVDKKTSEGSASSSITTTSDKLWLPSGEEVMGVTTWGRGKDGSGIGTWCYGGEGYQYKIFADAPLHAIWNGTKIQAMNGGTTGTFTVAPDALDGEADAYCFSTRFGQIYCSMNGETPSIATEFYAQNAGAIKGQGIDATSACDWWLRSPRYNYGHYFCIVNSDGNSYGSYASSSYGVAFGFCV